MGHRYFCKREREREREKESALWNTTECWRCQVYEYWKPLYREQEFCTCVVLIIIIIIKKTVSIFLLHKHCLIQLEIPFLITVQQFVVHASRSLSFFHQECCLAVSIGTSWLRKLHYYVKREKCKVNNVIFPSGCEERAINLGNKNMKISIFTGGTSVRSKNIFTDNSRYPTAKHKKKNDVSTVCYAITYNLLFCIIVLDCLQINHW